MRRISRSIRCHSERASSCYVCTHITLDYYRGGSKRGGGILGLQANKKRGGPGGGPTLGPMLKSLHRVPKRGVRTLWTPLNPPIYYIIKHTLYIIMYPHRRGIRFVFDLASQFFLSFFLSKCHNSGNNGRNCTIFGPHGGPRVPLRFSYFHLGVTSHDLSMT